jgi:PAS domain S-box-containing protein
VWLQDKAKGRFYQRSIVDGQKKTVCKKEIVELKVVNTGLKPHVGAVRESEENVRAIFDNFRDWILVTDVATKKFVFGNQTIYQMLGYALGELMVLGVSDIHLKRDLPKIMEVFEKLVNKEIKVGRSIPVQRKDGSTFYADINAFPIELGGKTCLVGVFRDIAERKKAEEVLQESEEQLRAYLENAPDGVYIYDFEGNILYANRRCEEIIGYKSEEVVGSSFRKLKATAKSSLGRARELLQNNINGKGTGPDELELVRKDGRCVPVEINTSIVKRSGQKVVLAFIRDITERKKVEVALRESEERFRRLSENAPDVIYRYRLKPVPGFEYVSTALVKYSGYTPEEFYADPKAAWKIVHPEDKNKYKQHFLMPESFGMPLILRWMHKDGQVIWSEEIDVPVYNANRELIAYEGIIRDITTRKQFELALQESEAQYRQLAVYHKQLNEISISFIEAADTQNLFNRIAETLRILTGAIASTFSVYDKETRDLKVVSLSIDPVSRDKVDSVFGPGLFEMRMPVGADDMKDMIGQGIRRPKDVYELSFGVVPQEISDAIMDAVGCRQIIALAITYSEELFGTCIVYLHGDQPVVPDEALKTFIYLSGLAIKRRGGRQN